MRADLPPLTEETQAKLAPLYAEKAVLSKKLAELRDQLYEKETNIREIVADHYASVATHNRDFWMSIGISDDDD